MSARNIQYEWVLKREWCIAKIDVHLECVLSASACSSMCVCLPMCVRNCLCVVEYLIHVCTQTINMIKKTANNDENTIHEIGIHYTHSSMRLLLLLMMMTKSAWMAKMTTSTNCFFRVAFWTCFSPLSPNIYLCDYFDTYTYHFFLFYCCSIRSLRFVFVFGFTFLKFWFYFPRYICLTRILSVFSVFIFCTLRINLPKA